MYSLKILRRGVSINEKKYILQELDIKEKEKDSGHGERNKNKNKTKKNRTFYSRIPRCFV